MTGLRYKTATDKSMNKIHTSNITGFYGHKLDETVNLPRVGESLLWLLFFAFLSILGAMLHFIIVDVVISLLSQGVSAERVRTMKESLIEGPTGMAGIYLVQFCMLMPALLWASNFESQPWRETLNLIPFALKSLGFWFLILVAFLLSHKLFIFIFGSVSTEFHNSVRGSKNLWFALQMVVLAPILEELLFRGYFFKAWRHSRLGLRGTLLLTSVLFAGAHWAQWHWKLLAPIFLLSVILGLVRERTGSVWVPIILHSLCNLLFVISVVYLVF